MKKLSGWITANGLLLWRVAVLISLIWIAVELRAARDDMPTTWDVEGQLREIAHRLDTIVDRLDR